MAIAISNIPVLKGEEAETFIKKAQEAERERDDRFLSAA